MTPFSGVVLVFALHTFRRKGADPFGFPTIERPWDDETDTLENAYRRARAAFGIYVEAGC